MADTIQSSDDGVVAKTASGSPNHNKSQEMEVSSPADVSRSKLQIAAILLALNVRLSVFSNIAILCG